jgi:hypothetical protein
VDVRNDVKVADGESFTRLELFWGDNPQAEVDDVAGEREEKRLKKEWIL